MKSFAVVIFFAMSLCRFFQTTNGLSCYSCTACDGNVSNYTKMTCGSALLAVAFQDASSAAPAAPEGSSAAPAAPPSAGPSPATGAHFCYTAKSKTDDKENRGCATTVDCKDIKTFEFKSCATCNTDNCNNVTAAANNSVVPGISVQCALLTSMVIARMFFQNK